MTLSETATGLTDMAFWERMLERAGLPLVMLLCGCVATTGDLDRIHQRIEAGEERIEAALADFESGLIDAEEVTGAIRSAWGENKAEVARVARDVTERGGVAWDTIIYAVTAAASVCVPGSVVLTNRMRDSRRARRNEPVAVAPSKGKVS